jgi:aminopeptidase
MTDPRVTELAYQLIHYSVTLQPGENILIENFGNELPLTRALIREAQKKSANVFVSIKNQELTRALLESGNLEQIKLAAKFEMDRMQQMQAYIGLRVSDNISAMANLPTEIMHNYALHYQKPVHSDLRVPNTKWCVLRYPNHSMAQLSQMPTEQFEDFYFEVCNLDYSKLSSAMDALASLMNTTKKVRLTGVGTDITFSIEGIPAIKCDGKYNIPDGEVFTAPVKDSVEGTITFNTPSIYHGTQFSEISFTFQEGKIIKSSANLPDKLEDILNTDDGARYIGEFAIGCNPFILHPMMDTLFDEKIAGSIHFTPGNCYDDAPNGNKSAVHWDLVLIQRPDYGGGCIYFDDVLIRKDGLFTLETLKGLNPEHFRCQL